MQEFVHDPAASADISALTDEALCLRCRREPALQEVLIRRYAGLVRACTRPLYLAGADREDLWQEGMIGLLEAIRAYEPDRGSFSAFAAICIRRQAVSAVRAADARKHQPLNASVPFQVSSFGNHDPEIFRIEELDPEDVVIGQETSAAFWSRLDASLSRLEKKVLSYYLQGLSYQEIAQLLHRAPKSVDNAIQRIRAKAGQCRQNGDNGI